MRRVAVDFDGTLVEEAWPSVGDWLPGAVDALKALASEFDEVVIWTCRVAPVECDEKTPRNNIDQIQLINDMLNDAEIYENVYVWTKPYKPPAVAYIDNRAIRYNGGWGTVISKLEFEILKTIEYPGVRTFSTGATRDSEDGKPSYAAYLSPLVIKRYGEYMLRHETQADGEKREPGNWKKGMPLGAYMESEFRHHMDLWLHHEGLADEARESLEDALCAKLFNTMGYLHTVLTEGLASAKVPA